MKKINFILLIGLCFLGSCGEGFLDSELLTSKTEGSFYKTPADAALALIGCYDGFQKVWTGGISLPVASEVFSDNCFGGTGSSDGFGYQMIDEFDKDRSPSDVNVFESNWSEYYATIFRVNKLLQSLDNIEWKNSGDARKQIEGEARFIRAMSYFDLVRLFGHIPLIEAPTIDNVPQADPEEIYALIGSDLLFAANNLAATPYSASWAASNDGRVTKWAAESMMARVFLYYTGYYQSPTLPTKEGTIAKNDVLGMLEDVISNSGHGLLEDFANLWPAASVGNFAGEGNKESIFSIKYTFTSNYNGNSDGNHWLVMFGMRQTDSYPYGRGWGGATVNPNLYNAYNENDTRKQASIIDVVKEEIEIDISTQREYTGYYVKKFSPMLTQGGQSLAESFGGVNFQIGQFQDYVVIRYADVLLMAAELGSIDAQNDLDLVRKRALKDNFSSIPATKENILNERRLEFAFEGLRYWDLLRQGLGVAESALKVSNVTVLNGGATAVKNVNFNVLTKGLQQIPYNQINLSSGVLIQNAGW